MEYIRTPTPTPSNTSVHKLNVSAMNGPSVPGMDLDGSMSVSKPSGYIWEKRCVPETGTDGTDQSAFLAGANGGECSKLANNTVESLKMGGPVAASTPDPS